MPDDKISVAFIGCGDVAAVHAQCLATLGGARIVACCDIDELRAMRFRESAGAAYSTTDAANILHDERVQAVYICTHHDSHVPLALAAIEAGKAIFMEKPLALTISECEEICVAVERRHALFFMGFKMRFYPLVDRARRFMPQPRMIAAQMMDTRWADEFWANDPRKGGGNVLSEGVHTFDLMCHLAGARPVRIYAEAKNLHHAELPIVDGLVATVVFDNGAIASVTQGDLGHPALVSKFSFQLFDGVKTVHLHDRLKTGTFYDGHESHEIVDDDELGYLNENRVFLDCVRTGSNPPCDHIDGWRATMLIQRAFMSAASQIPQDLSGLW